MDNNNNANYNSVVRRQVDVTTSDYVSRFESKLYNEKQLRNPEYVKFYVELVNERGEVKPIQLYKNGPSIYGLILTVNPYSISSNLAKIVNRTQSMVGWIEEHWGDEMDAITIEGSTASFMYRTGMERTLQEYKKARSLFNEYMNIVDIGSTTTNTGESGLTVALRRETASYEEMKAFIEVMNSSGLIFDEQGFPKERLYTQMSTDYVSFRGYIESFDTVEEVRTPFRFTYIITFKSEQTIYNFIR